MRAAFRGPTTCSRWSPRDGGPAVDPARSPLGSGSAVGDIVRKQVGLGVDVIDDGEMGKPGFIHLRQRAPRAASSRAAMPRPAAWAGSREVQAFPEFYAWFGRVLPSPAATAAALGLHRPDRPTRATRSCRPTSTTCKPRSTARAPPRSFVPAISPSNVEDWHRNEYYKTQEEYLFAIADAMREEYKAIVDAGFVAADRRPAAGDVLHPRARASSLAECRAWAAARVEALNHALRGIPEDRVRFHTCYSINIGPRVHDMELKDIVDIILRIRAGAYSFEAANPRHEHEWRVWEDVKLPDGKVLIPGVITQSSVLVEHPELVAERIERFAGVVGRENVIAGADCGFATFAGSMEIHPSIAWAKLDALAEGARLASRRLWGRA